MSSIAIDDVSKVFETKIVINDQAMGLSLHILPTFTGRVDLALKINGRTVELADIESKRGGNVWYHKRKSGSIWLNNGDRPTHDASANENKIDIDNM